MARYGKKAQDSVKKAMKKKKKGQLKSGRSGKKVTSRKQAIAIGLSEARKEGGKVPKKKTTKKAAKKSTKKKKTTKSAKAKSTKKKAAKKKSTKKKTTKASK
ncbi:MAG TPA: DUF6496 domain-containing protein [Oligoflexus sp.]|uniref:DUF6496 domain-containing protein n=1 Tax=Oligoflexus sp. TaxID=1971216 RepID=UPI002D7F03A6|nr:DUF6496 domain-containing protein [Oligoflexus sp.]HET9238486.1 DUF6496 domain-containing protein [Oligoflexus sp.]